jgi:hypothetical protein
MNTDWVSQGWVELFSDGGREEAVNVEGMQNEK